MRRLQGILFTIVICINAVLSLFVLAGSHLQPPRMVQVLGRMHPLVLHFPIVFIIIYILWRILLRQKAGLAGPMNDEAGDWLLLLSAFSAALTALFGILLSREEGYQPDAIAWHKWSGWLLSLLTLGWYAYRRSINAQRVSSIAVSVLAFVLVLYTGHEGATITHGENYLLAPVMPEKRKPKPSLEQAIVFKDMVNPILEEKCMGCHNSKKAKGRLVMETEAQLMKGGKHGALWAAGHPELSLLMERIQLPEGEKRHMPPTGKPQLDPDEIAIVYQWIKGGAAFGQKLNQLPPTDSLRILASSYFGAEEEVDYNFAAVNEDKVAALNNANRVVKPLALASPALAAGFYNRGQYNTEALRELEAVKTQLVSLDLAYMPLQEKDLQLIRGFTNLRRLNLNFTGVPGKSLAALSNLRQLQELSLAGTATSLKDLESLKALPALRELSLWQSPAAADPTALKAIFPTVDIEAGTRMDTVLLKLNPPQLETEERIIQQDALALKLKHYVKGSSIHYTLDGSTPDSLHSKEYTGELLLDHAAIFKARAFKQGWLGSDSITARFLKNSFKADSILNLQPLDSVYHGSNGARVLIDGVKGGYNKRDGSWLGFRRNRMEILIRYPAPVSLHSITLSCLVDIGSFVMPPQAIEVWGGSAPQDLHRLTRLLPSQPDTVMPASQQAYECRFPLQSVKYIKLIAWPVSSLPAWHPAKKQKGWLFADEILVN